MQPDDLKPKIPDGSGQRIFGGIMIAVGVLVMLGPRSWGNLADLLFGLGTTLLVWGSILGWLRVIEDRQIALHRHLIESQRKSPWHG